MVTKRIIPCLDVKDGRVVKGVNFRNIQDAGNVVELAKSYYQQGADELTLLDISASNEGRLAMIDVVKSCADQIFIPLTVGGGISNIDDVDRLLRAGADKISINSAAVKTPQLINQIVDRFGSQILVLSVDARRVAQADNQKPADFSYEITTHGGKKGTKINALRWVEEAIERGVGEVLLNSMDADGTKHGFDLEMTRDVRQICSVPLIASGGAGKVEDFYEVIKETDVDAVLAASVFHYQELTIDEVKEDLKKYGVSVR